MLKWLFPAEGIYEGAGCGIENVNMPGGCVAFEAVICLESDMHTEEHIVKSHILVD